MKILLLRGVKSPKRQKKFKTLQNSSTKALLATIGQFEEKFIKGMYPIRWGMGHGIVYAPIPIAYKMTK
jgi:hypothetical protein